MNQIQEQLEAYVAAGKKQIYRYDASALKNSSCGLRLKRDVVDGYGDKVKYNDTFYGSGLHKFLHVMAESDGNFQEAVVGAKKVFAKHNKIRPKKEHLNEVHLLKTCFDYWEHIGQSENHIDLVINPEAKCWKCNGKGSIELNDNTGCPCPICNGNKTRQQPMVEVTFDIPMYECDLFQINLAGTIDRTCKIKNGCYCVRDYKTTSSWMIPAFLKSFRNSTQLYVYVWALRKIARMNPGSFLDEVTRYPMGAFIDGIFLKSKTETIFASSEMFPIKEVDLDIFEQMLYFKTNEIAQYIQSSIDGDADPFPTGMIEGLCGGFLPCKYIDVCSAPDEVSRRHVLINNFKQSPYNPLTFGEQE